jgi:amino acid transporter/nucleotide-binding universal stress UspA family protein
MKKFDTEVRLSREMSLMDATMIGVGAMIGAGIFVLTGIAAGVAGPALIITFALNGFVALFTAMAYAELGSCYHDAGGGYLWVKEGLPKWNGFVSGWMSWFAHAVACSLYAIGFGAYFELVFHEFGIHVPELGFLSLQKILAGIVAVVFAYINFRGASETGKIGNIVTMAKVVIIMIFVAFGLEIIFRRGSLATSMTPFMPHGWSGIFKAMGLTFIAFQGFEVIAQSSEEIKNPRKNIPRAIFLSLLIVVPIYLLVAVTALGSVNPGSLTPWDFLAKYKETALVQVARGFFSGGGILILIGGLISTMSALNATVYSSSRVAFAMGRDRNFPTFFSKVHPKRYSPHWAILASLIIVVVMTLSLPIEDVASAADIMFLLLFLQVNLAMIRLRKKRPDLDRGFFVPIFPWLSILGIGALLFLAVYMFNYSLTAWIVTIFWIGAGMVVYASYASKREIEHVRKVRALEKIERKQYRILVCLSNPKNVTSLTSVALAIAAKHKGRIIFSNVIEVHEGEPLMVGLDATARARPLLEKAEQMALEAEVPCRSIIEVSHRVSQGIVDAAIEEDCNFIVIGRQKRPNFLDRVFSSLIDTVLQKSPSEVAVLHGAFRDNGVRNILVPFAANIHTRLATELAPTLVEYFNAHLRIGVVFDPETAQYKREERLEQIKALNAENNLKAEIIPVVERDVLQGILRLSRGVDLVLMGGRSGDAFQLMFAKSLSQEITEQVDCPVLWVREYEERQSLRSSLLKSLKKVGEDNGEDSARALPGSGE